jgi:hypothetical protein
VNSREETPEHGNERRIEKSPESGSRSGRAQVAETAAQARGGRSESRGWSHLDLEFGVAYLFLRVEKKEKKRQKKGAEALQVVE